MHGPPRRRAGSVEERVLGLLVREPPVAPPPDRLGTGGPLRREQPVVRGVVEGVGPVVAGATVSTAANLGLTETSTNGGDLATTNSFVQGLDITTFAGAQRALEVVDKALTSVNGARADLGAIQNRLEHTINRLGMTSENLQAAESRIRDADMAQEMIKFTKNQILQQSGTAMLAQANSAPQSVLSLLR